VDSITPGCQITLTLSVDGVNHLLHIVILTVFRVLEIIHNNHYKACNIIALLLHFRPRGPLLWLDPGAFGTLGVGGGFALGAKLCRPNSDVYILYGDGSLGYSVAEFDTYTRHKVDSNKSKIQKIALQC